MRAVKCIRWGAKMTIFRVAFALWLALSAETASAQQVMRDGFEESCFVDTDDDRLSNCEEVNLGLNYSQPDTDGDGLKDGDEVLGTTEGLNLPAIGVNPRHKDLLVEMDWTDEAFECAQHTHRPLAATVEEVRTFYANIPAPNVDGVTGINFIADFGQGGVFNGGNFVPITDGITTPLEAPFFQYKANNFASNRQGYFRYQLHGHRWAYGEPSSGWGDIGGDNSVVTLRCINSSNNVRNTIIHELGHNLSLHHGGDSACNAKPNYNSLMNYNYQFFGLDMDCDRFGDGIDLLGYSDGSRRPLVQGALIESDGVCAAAHPFHRAIDWNVNGVIDAGPVTSFNPLATKCAETDVASDFNDYAALAIAPYAPQGGGAPPPAEGSGECASPPD